MSDRFTMRLNLNILNHLGIRLYSNVPAVLSEVVANAWDACSKNVLIDFDIENDKITIEDDGDGMDLIDINNKFLMVGYERRKDQGDEVGGRKVMGRKGIGKLSLFSIAKVIRVESQKGSHSPEGLILESSKIEQIIEQQNIDPEQNVEYHPTEIPQHEISKLEKGTRITITGLKKRVQSQTVDGLKKRIARRFTIIGDDFDVCVNGQKIGVKDRDYYHKVEYLWHYGLDKKFLTNFTKLKQDKSGALRSYPGDNCLTYIGDDEKPKIVSVKGWIGTVARPSDLKDEQDSINRVVLVMRGKMAQEDMLEEFRESGNYASYLIGEIEANFLDQDGLDDIAVSSRQQIVRDDPRYHALKEWLRRQLKIIQGKWSEYRNEEGESEARQIQAVNDWMENLSPDDKKRAANLFGKIHQLTVEDPAQKKALFKHGVLAFESFRARSNLDALEQVSPESLEAFTAVFQNIDDVEESMYYVIVRQRLEVIKRFRDQIESNVLEKVIQEMLFNHLWLLDPTWDRATDATYMEERVETSFQTVSDNLTDEERRGRFDIRYKKSSGKHILIELKRSSVNIESSDLQKQVLKYKRALEKIFTGMPSESGPIDIICLIGKPCSDWYTDEEERESRRSLATRGIRVILYKALIQESYQTYSKYFDEHKKASRISNLLDAIDEADFD